MVRLVLAAFIAATALVGCGSSQVAVTESAPDKAAIAESKAAWTPDKVEAFKKAHAEEGRLTLAKPPGWDGKAFMLADAKKHPLFLNCRGDELVIQLDKQFSNPMDTVVVLEP